MADLAVYRRINYESNMALGVSKKKRVTLVAAAVVGIRRTQQHSYGAICYRLSPDG